MELILAALTALSLIVGGGRSGYNYDSTSIRLQFIRARRLFDNLRYE